MEDGLKEMRGFETVARKVLRNSKMWRKLLWYY